ncbi:protein furry homolog isoform X1 [Tachysurus ichikawai]
MPKEDAVPSDTNSCDAQSQDGIVLVQMANLSMDMFTPGDFKGKFRKIQPKKRPTIIREDTPDRITFQLGAGQIPVLILISKQCNIRS